MLLTPLYCFLGYYPPGALVQVHTNKLLVNTADRFAWLFSLTQPSTLVEVSLLQKRAPTILFIIKRNFAFAAMGDNPIVAQECPSREKSISQVGASPVIALSEMINLLHIV
jgi:hypothetical protein